MPADIPAAERRCLWSWENGRIFLQPIFSAALNGMEDYDATVKNRTPVYFVVGEDDEYYGSEPSREAYQKLHDLYEEEGLSDDEIDDLLVLDIKNQNYF